MAVDSRAAALSARVDALAAALRAAGVSPERSSALLASAAEATMHAVTLEALLDQQHLLAASQAGGASEPAPRRVQLAA